MPHNNSAKKRLRQNEVRRVRNKSRTSELHTLRKRIDRAIHDGQKSEAEILYRQLTKRLDQAASVHVLHANTASRTKARVALAIGRIGTAPAPGAKSKAKPATRAAAPVER